MFKLINLGNYKIDFLQQGLHRTIYTFAREFIWEVIFVLLELEFW